MDPQDKSSKISRFSHFAAIRPRLLLALALGAIAVAIASTHRWPVHLLLDWDITVQTHLVLTTVTMLRADPHRIRAAACREDARTSAVLAIVCLGVVASTVAIAFELATAKSAGHAQTSHYVFTGTTVLGAQLIVPMMSAVHYTYLYYRTPYEPPLRFPDEQLEPDYWDFLCSSFTIVVADQTTDVSIHSRTTRRAVLGQSLLSFLPSTSILALSINIVVGLFL